ALPPGRPGDPEREPPRRAEPEVDGLVAAGADARRAAEHLAHERAAAEAQGQPSAAAVAVRDRADGVDLEPVVAAPRGDVAVQVRRALLVDDEDVEAAVAVEVADGDSPRRAGIVGEARRAQVEEGAMPVVQQDLVPQRMRPRAEP